MNKAWRVYTEVVHPYMMQQVSRVPVGSSPMGLDAFRPSKWRSSQAERLVESHDFPLLTGMGTATVVNRADLLSRGYPQMESPR